MRMKMLNQRIQWTRRLRLRFQSCIIGGAPLMRNVRAGAVVRKVYLNPLRFF